jgi:nucleolar pre-ribosomal-associated protein 1
LLKKAFKNTREESDIAEIKSESESKSRQKTATEETLREDLLEKFGGLPVEDESHSGLYRWERNEIEVSLEQGYVGELVLCLCSEHEEIRRQASVGLSRFMFKIKVSFCLHSLDRTRLRCIRNPHV